MTDESFLPKPKRSGWLIIYSALGSLAVLGLVLGLIYRDSSKPGDVLKKERHKNAKAVSYAIVFSRVDGPDADSIINGILADIGADSLTTDMVVGSTVSDPWCATSEEYRRMLKKAMTETKELPIGKQTLIMSMVAGLLTKNELPARVYLVGRMNGPYNQAIIGRTQQTSAAFDLRAHAMGPVNVISYLRPALDTMNVDYERYFTQRNYPFTKR